MVYVAINKDLNDERYENETSLISHFTKNDSWIIDSGCSRHMIFYLRKIDKFEEINVGGTLKFGSDVPYSSKGKGSLTLNIRSYVIMHVGSRTSI